ncbi:hypothetical protein GCM10010201_18930 [Pilimelia columellifera subsp. columellifera]|uniref:Uncharacterized protein n=1 Tax=Pilimelia columellifera subsp. columellifera TaxID=706583 RepID=A0ABP6ARG6_9ACTN
MDVLPAAAVAADRGHERDLRRSVVRRGGTAAHYGAYGHRRNVSAFGGGGVNSGWTGRIAGPGTPGNRQLRVDETPPVNLELTND